MITGQEIMQKQQTNIKAKNLNNYRKKHVLKVSCLNGTS